MNVKQLHSKSGCLTSLRHSVCHLYPSEVNDVTDTAIRPKPLRRSRRAGAKAATDNIGYVQDFLEDEPSPDWLLVNGGWCTDLDFLFIHLPLFLLCSVYWSGSRICYFYATGRVVLLHMHKTTWSRICSNHYDQLYSKRNEPVNNNSNFADNSIGCISYIARSLYNPIFGLRRHCHTKACKMEPC